jgi:hypothetical protein
MALAWRAVLDLPRFVNPVPVDDAPPGSLNAVRKMAESKKGKQVAWYDRG